MKVLRLILIAILAILVSVPALLALPFTIPGTCANNFCLYWGLFAGAAASPMLLLPVLIVAALAKVRSITRLVIECLTVGLPAGASAFVIHLIATAPG